MAEKKQKEKTVKITGFVIAEKSKGSSVKTIDEIITDTKTINVLDERIKNLEEKEREISSSINKAEKRQDRAVSFMMWVAGIIIIAFFLSLIPLLFDYYKDNSTRYENYTKKIDELNLRVQYLERKN